RLPPLPPPPRARPPGAAHAHRCEPGSPRWARDPPRRSAGRSVRPGQANIRVTPVSAAIPSPPGGFSFREAGRGWSTEVVVGWHAVGNVGVKRCEHGIESAGQLLRAPFGLI